MTFRLLQVCNVGQITGGTAACAWTVTRAFPAAEHTVICLSPPTPETIAAFAACHLRHEPRLTAALVRETRADIVLLHNTSPARCEPRFPAVSVQYLHSRITPAPADLTIYCSRWLAEQCRIGTAAVCVQAVPRPLKPETSASSRVLRDRPVIGRICTPVAKKWPRELPEFYADLAHQFPQVRWEFIGCPPELVPALQSACGPQAHFEPAGWQARRRLWAWDALLYHNPHVTESFGRTVAEAMRTGCIPIVDHRGGFREQMVPGTGFLCSAPADYSAALCQLLDPGERLRRSRACRAHADEHFSLTRFARDLLIRFEQAAGTRVRRVQKGGEGDAEEMRR